MKLGDRVKIVRFESEDCAENIIGHPEDCPCSQVGMEGVIIDINDMYPPINVRTSKSIRWWYSESDLELITNNDDRRFGW